MGMARQGQVHLRRQGREDVGLMRHQQREPVLRHTVQRCAQVVQPLELIAPPAAKRHLRCHPSQHNLMAFMVQQNGTVFQGLDPRAIERPMPMGAWRGCAASRLIGPPVVITEDVENAQRCRQLRQQARDLTRCIPPPKGQMRRVVPKQQDQIGRLRVNRLNGSLGDRHRRPGAAQMQIGNHCNPERRPPRPFLG